MNKLIASLIVGAFSAAAWASSPVASPVAVSGVSPTPTSVVAKAAPADKAHAKSVSNKEHVAKKVDAVK